MFYVAKERVGLYKVVDTCDKTPNLSEYFSEEAIRRTSKRVYGVSPDKITPLSYEDAVKQAFALFLLTHKDRIKFLEGNVYMDCSGLKEIVCPGCGLRYRFKNADTVIYDRDAVFMQDSIFGDSEIKRLVLSDNLISISEDCCSKCGQLKYVEFGKNIKFIDNNAFWHTGVVEVDMPDSVERLGHGVFYQCYDLQKINLSKSLTKIPKFTFSLCNRLMQIVIPEGVSQIELCAFEGCTSLKNIKFPDSLKSIEKSAFLDCKCLEEIKLPDNLEEIGTFAFKGCNLSRVVIPRSCKSIGKRAFMFNSNLKELVVPKGLAFETNVLADCPECKVTFY